MCETPRPEDYVVPDDYQPTEEEKKIQESERESEMMLQRVSSNHNDTL